MVEIKQVRSYLWRVRDAERELKLLEQEYEQAKANILHLKAIQYDADKVSGGKIGDLSDAIVVLEGYAERVNAQWDKLVALRNEAGTLIEQIADGRYREVLKRRYLHGQTLERIAVDLGYSYRQIKRIHGGALCRFKKMSFNVPFDL
ncbi:MAG: sigma factor-like helix-turn-helix DNA-binding protein [Selenomonas massiliensis]